MEKEEIVVWNTELYRMLMKIRALVVPVQYLLFFLIMSIYLVGHMPYFENNEVLLFAGFFLILFWGILNMFINRSFYEVLKPPTK